MLAAAVIGLIYAVIQLIFTICQFATGVTNSFNYQLDFYGDKVYIHFIISNKFIIKYHINGENIIIYNLIS